MPRLPSPSTMVLAAALALVLAARPTAAADGCSDVRPRMGQGFAVGPACAEVVARGDCNADWVKTSIKELPEGYCQISCGRCATCRTLDDTLRSSGLTAVADAAAASPWGPAFKQPGTVLTLLAPTGGFRPADVGRHVLLSPPAWGNATWTGALLAGADSVPTAAGEPVKLGGVKITRADVGACKSVIHVVDGAL